MLRRATAVLALTSLLSAGVPRPAAAAPDATPFPILFVTQVPDPGRLHDHRLDVRQPPTAMDSVAARRRPLDPLSRRHAQEPDARARATASRAASRARTRSPCASRPCTGAGTKALFSMVIGAPPQQYQYATRLLADLRGHRPRRGRHAGHHQGPEPAGELQQRRARSTAPTTASSSRPTARATAQRISTRSSTSTRRRRRSPASGASNPATGDLRLLNHSPSGAFTPIVDSFGRVIFTRWDHLQRDQQADADADRRRQLRHVQLRPTRAAERRAPRPTATRSSPSRAPSASTCWRARTSRATPSTTSSRGR